MNLEELRNLSQGADKDKEKQILQICDPQKIANDLIHQLEIRAKEAAKAGDRVAHAFFCIWAEWPLGKKEGPLLESKSDELARVLFNMVQRYITDSNIKLTLRDREKDHNTDLRRIIAEVSW